MNIYLVYIDNPDGPDWESLYDITESAVVLAETAEEAIELIKNPPDHQVESNGEKQGWNKVEDYEGNVVFEQPLYIDPKYEWKAVQINSYQPGIVLGHIHYG